MVSNTVDDSFQQQIVQKIFKSKFEARSVNAGFDLGFKHRISFAADLAATFGCNRSRIIPEIISKLLLITI